MRSVLTAFFLAASACLAQAGVLVELTDGTKLTVESHWNDGDQVHLVRGGVDMIVAKSRIKSIDEAAADPEVYRNGAQQDAKPAEGEADAPAAASAAQEGEKPLGEMSAGELEQLHVDEANKLLELQDKRFGALYGGGASPEEQQKAKDAFATQNKRNAKVWFALEKARKAEAGVPSVPAVEQPQ
jgi:hypothetical protein